MLPIFLPSTVCYRTYMPHIRALLSLWSDTPNCPTNEVTKYDAEIFVKKSARQAHTHYNAPSLYVCVSVRTHILEAHYFDF